MNRLDGHFIRELVARTQGITLQVESAQRTADINVAVTRTLDPIAAESLFDTEPAQLERMLRRLSGESDHG